MEKKSFDRVATQYDATRGYAEGVAERIRNAIVAYTGATLDSRFLEVGIGTGRVALPFIQAGYNYTGVDISQKMMNRLSEKLEADHNHNNYKYELRLADAETLPFPNHSFDIALAVHVFHLVPDFTKAAQEVARVLRPNGWLLIAFEASDDKDPDVNTVQFVRTKWDNILQELGVTRTNPNLKAWGMNEAWIGYLKQMGATVEIVQLLSHNDIPVSPREMVNRLVNRLYSSDWQTSETIHAEASKRLIEWLQAKCTDPDTPLVSKSVFTVVGARFIGQNHF